MQITFSGRLGGGKSTVCAILKEKYGYDIYTTGITLRSVADEMGISVGELNKKIENDPALDHKIDYAVVDVSRQRKGEKLVFDSRMAWHFAEDTFKVYMYVDQTVAGERVYAADRGTVEKYKDAEDAKLKLLQRSNDENIRYKKIYGVDNLDYSNYDLILDSTVATPEDIAFLIIENLKEYEKKPFEKTKVLLSPITLYPTKPLECDDDDECARPVISVKNGLHYVVKGHKWLKKALEGHAIMTSVELDKSAAEPFTTREILSQYENKFGFKYETYP